LRGAIKTISGPSILGADAPQSLSRLGISTWKEGAALLHDALEKQPAPKDRRRWGMVRASTSNGRNAGASQPGAPMGAKAEVVYTNLNLIGSAFRTA
jgi:hypothetical protein